MNKHFLLIAGFAVGLSTTAHASQQLVFQCADNRKIMFTQDLSKAREIPIFDNLPVHFQEVGTPILNFNPEDPEIKSFVFGRHSRTAVYAEAPQSQNDLSIQIKVQSDTGTHLIQCIRADLVQMTIIGTKIRFTHFDAQNDFVSLGVYTPRELEKLNPQGLDAFIDYFTKNSYDLINIETQRRNKIAQGQRALIFKHTKTGAYISMYVQDALKHGSLTKGHP